MEVIVVKGSSTLYGSLKTTLCWIVRAISNTPHRFGVWLFLICCKNSAKTKNVYEDNLHIGSYFEPKDIKTTGGVLKSTFVIDQQLKLCQEFWTYELLMFSPFLCFCLVAEQDIVLVHATKLDYFKLFSIWSAYLGNQSRLFRHFYYFICSFTA